MQNDLILPIVQRNLFLFAEQSVQNPWVPEPFSEISWVARSPWNPSQRNLYFVIIYFNNFHVKMGVTKTPCTYRLKFLKRPWFPAIRTVNFCSSLFILLRQSCPTSWGTLPPPPIFLTEGLIQVGPSNFFNATTPLPLRYLLNLRMKFSRKGKLFWGSMK